MPLNFEAHERGVQFGITEFRGVVSGNETALEFSGSGEWAETNLSAQVVALDFGPIPGKTIPGRSIPSLNP